MKRKFFIGLIFLFTIMNVFAKRDKYKTDITDILDKQSFEQIMQYVLDHGDRQTYCNMYNKNPHYCLDSINIYLNPIDQWTNPFELSEDEISDYNQILIADRNSGAFYILLEDNKVYIWNLYKYKKQKIYENQIIEIYIPILKNLIRSKPQREEEISAK